MRSSVWSMNSLFVVLWTLGPADVASETPDEATSEPRWAEEMAAADWVGLSGMETLLDGTFRDCDVAPGGDLTTVWSPTEIRACRKKQRKLRGSLKGRRLVMPSEVRIAEPRGDSHEVRVRIRGWACHDVLSINHGQTDLVSGQRYIITDEPKSWWKSVSCPWKPVKPLSAFVTEIELSADELANLEQAEVYILVELVRVTRIRAKRFRLKSLGRWHSFKPTIEGIKAKPVAWKIKLKNRTVYGP